MSRLIELPPVGRVVFVVALTIVAITLLITLENGAHRTAVTAPAVVATADPQRAALSRCRALGEASTSDPACYAVWRESRARFFGGERPQ